MADKESEEGSVGVQADILTAKQHGLFGSTGIQLTETEYESVVTTKFLRHMNSIQEIELNKLRSMRRNIMKKGRTWKS